MTKLRAIPLAAAGVFLTATIVQAAYTLFGEAGIVTPGNASLGALRVSSDVTAGDPFGGASFTVPSNTSVNDLSMLQTDYLVLDGDCRWGAPRFSIRVDMDDDGVASSGDRNIFVYVGPHPNFTNCPAGWQSTGNLLSDIDSRVDTGQVGGTFYDTLAHAKVLVGSKLVLRISLVVDAGFAGDPQIFDVDNVDINGDLYDFEPTVPGSIDACRNGGWQALTRTDFTSFKNQGDCIQYVNTGK
jgi:hypothetical protein